MTVLFFSVRFGVSLSSGSSPEGSVRNGKQGCGSAREEEEEEGQDSAQAASSTKYPTPQSQCSSKLPSPDTFCHTVTCVFFFFTCSYLR